jgi:hypothetical protein
MVVNPLPGISYLWHPNPGPMRPRITLFYLPHREFLAKTHAVLPMFPEIAFSMVFKPNGTFYVALQNANICFWEADLFKNGLGHVGSKETPVLVIGLTSERASSVGEFCWRGMMLRRRISLYDGDCYPDPLFS